MKRQVDPPEGRAPRRKKRDLDAIIDALAERAGDDEIAEHELRAVALISDLADEVFAMRTNQGLTQAELAQQCGMSQPAIAVLENPGVDREPTLTTLIKVGLGLGKKVVVTFEDQDDTKVTGNSSPPELIVTLDDGQYHETELTT